MRTIAVLFISSILGSTAALSGGDELESVEHARAIARTGGPVSELDAYYLERYGCQSGTDNPVCFRSREEYLSQHKYNRNLKRHRHRHRD